MDVHSTSSTCPEEGAPAGYKQTEVGVIPQDWEVRSLEGIADPKQPICYGIVQVGPFSNNGIPVLAIKNLNTDYRTNVHQCSPEIEAPYTRSRVHSGDILISVKGTTGRVGIVPPYFDGNISRDLARIRLSKDHLPKYWLQMLQSDTAQRVFDLATVGTTRLEISIGILKQIRLPFPSLDEQRAIAEALSDVDGLLGSLEKLIAKKWAIKQVAMQQLLTGKTRLPGFSGAWETRQLGEVIHLISSGIYGLGRQTGLLIGMPVATTAHIDPDDRWNNKKMDIRYFTEHQITHFSPMEGDLIVVKSSGSAASIQSGKIGYVSHDKVGSFVFSNFMMLLRPTRCNAQFLFFQLVSSRMKKMLPYLVEASTYPNLRINDYLELQIPLPSDEEQAAIVDVLSDMDAEITALERRRDKTHTIKQGMMQQFLTGRVRLVGSREGNDYAP